LLLGQATGVRMIPERWEKISDILHQAMKLDSTQRSAFLEHRPISDPDSALSWASRRDSNSWRMSERAASRLAYA